MAIPVRRKISFGEPPLTEQPCTTGRHTTEVPISTPVPAAAKDEPNQITVENGVETYGVAPPSAAASSSKPTDTAAPIHAPTPPPAAVKHEEDDLALPVPSGARCKRQGCGAEWEGPDVSRGEGAKATCRYHPQAPVFHEGSKGYLCCKRRVLEFDEFLKIEGCTEGKHLFVGSGKASRILQLPHARARS